MVKMVNYALCIFLPFKTLKKRMMEMTMTSRGGHCQYREPQGLFWSLRSLTLGGGGRAESCLGGFLNEPLVAPLARSSVTAEQGALKSRGCSHALHEPYGICTARIISGT